MLESLLKIENLKSDKNYSKERVRGLDNVRFLCAICVACSHGGYPPITISFDRNNTIEWLINGIYTSLFCGPAAVIVFFLISGFCIHYPYRKTWRKKNIFPFLIARISRISVPIICATVIVKLIGFNTSIFYLLVGWSIVCEVSYYLFYPFLRSFIDTKKGWLNFLFLSFTPTALIFFYFPLNMVNYPGVGVYMVVALGLPCWILGLILSYNVSEDTHFHQISTFNLWCHRVLILFLAFLCHVFALQKIIGHPFTLNFFAIAAFFWLKKEILFHYKRSTTSYLESLGKASYSIYLMHGLPPFLISLLIKDISPVEKFYFYWVILIILVLFFYFLIEKPSHNLSRNLYRYLCKLQWNNQLKD
jgi:peptidoglycan/LPS O-acetylase OafA/YrhL